jgi:hypothetical protein
LGGVDESHQEHRTIRRCRRSDSFEMMEDGWYVESYNLLYFLGTGYGRFLQIIFFWLKKLNC